MRATFAKARASSSPLGSLSPRPLALRTMSAWPASKEAATVAAILEEVRSEKLSFFLLLLPFFFLSPSEKFF